MTPVRAGLVAVAVLTVVGVAVAFAGERRRVRLAPLVSMALGVAGTATGLGAWAGGTGELVVATVLPIRVAYSPDRLGGTFLALIGAVTAVSALWASGSARGAAASRTAWVAYPLFAAGLMAVAAAADVVAFLVAWEVMALASAVLVLADHARRPQVLGAGIWYAAMTHLSFLLVLGGFALLATEAGDTAFDALGDVDPGGRTASVAAVLLILGFAAKAGAVPLHVWLPRAHPEAPSHVSALMSAAMVKAGIYGVLLVVVRLLPGGPPWWGAVILVLGAVSAVFGILQAGVAADLKRLLAYSTTENVGLILCAVGAGQIMIEGGDVAAGHVLLVAALLLVLAHAAAKTTLFLAAGSLLHATGLRDLDRLGGLLGPMPWTGAAFGVAALGAAALPVSAGFVAEWTLLQALVQGGRSGDPWLGLICAITVGVVALTAGLALMTFTKAFGIAFLGRPRSPEAENGHEEGPAARAAMTLGGAAVVLLGLVPGPLASALAGSLGLEGVSGAGTTLAGGVRLQALAPTGAGLVATPVDPALLDPIALALAGLLAALVITAWALGLRRAAPRRRVDLAWGCGGVRISPRMQYTATSYAEPLVRVFDAALGTTRSVEATGSEAPYLVQEITFRQQLRDVVEERAYAPVLAAVRAAADGARRIPNGSVHRYLLWSFTAFLVVLTLAVR